jgi:5-methylcytosine-specific restriction enzyme subunit McrC
VTTVTLTEAGNGVSAELTGEQARLLAASGLVEVSPAAGGRWLVRGKGKVGVARLGDVELRIQPKRPVARLLFLLGYARDPGYWREELVLLAVDNDLVPAFAGTLHRQLARALAGGVLHGYRSVDEASPVLRGRLRETDQLGRHLGRPLPLEIRHDEFTIDIAENQILATAVHRMLRVPGVDEESMRALRHLLGKLTGVTLLSPGAVVPKWHASRLNARYLIALRLAEMVLASTSVEAGDGDFVSNAFIVDMPTLFEDFLTTALDEAIVRRHGGAVVRQSPHTLDRARRHTMRADIAWVDSGEVRAVVDAKYKTHTAAGDLYQMLAYCTVIGLRAGHLVYADGDGSTTHQIRNAEVEILTHVLDLDRPSEALLGDVDALADRIASHASIHPTGRTAQLGQD